MRWMLWFVRPGRALAALILLATLIAGEAADARHHLLDASCAGEASGAPAREGHCTCANLHAVSLAAAAPVALAPVVLDREFVAVTPA